MKTILSLAILMAITLCCHLPAQAASYGGNAFNLYSAAAGGVVTSSAISVRGFRTKTLTVSGATLNSNAGTQTFKNMSGTLIVQCAPTASGPWATCTQSQVASAPAVSLTANNQLSWADAVSYIRLKWTASTLGTKLKAWLNWIED